MGRETRGRAARKLGMKRAADFPSIMVRCSRELEPGFEALLHGRYLDARHLKNMLIPAKLQDLNKMLQVVRAREVPRRIVKARGLPGKGFPHRLEVLLGHANQIPSASSESSGAFAQRHLKKHADVSFDH